MVGNETIQPLTNNCVLVVSCYRHTSVFIIEPDMWHVFGVVFRQTKIYLTLQLPEEPALQYNDWNMIHACWTCSKFKLYVEIEEHSKNELDIAYPTKCDITSCGFLLVYCTDERNAFGCPYILLNQFVTEHHLTLITQRITFKGESKLIYIFGSSGRQPLYLVNNTNYGIH